MEFIDIVNGNNEVIGKLPQKEAYKQKFNHRIVHVLIFNTKGEMLLQLRNRLKNFCPLHWCTSVGGHVKTRETYEQAALREYEEELGVTSEIKLAYEDTYKDSQRGLTKFLSTFTTKNEGPFKINEREVEKVKFFSLEKISEMIKHGEKFHPEFLFLLRKHFNIK